MQKNIKLIGLDLDFTTLNAKKEITPRVALAIENAIKAGIIVLPATGRALCGITPAFLKIPGVSYALCSNGAKVYHLASGKVLVKNCFAHKTIGQILNVLCNLGTIPAVFINGKVYSAKMDFGRLVKTYDEKTIAYFKDSRIVVPDILKLVQEHPDQVEKISLIFYSLEDREKTKKALSLSKNCQLTSSLPANLEVNAKDVDKGRALLQLGQLLGIKKTQIMAVGDGGNDLEMLRAVGYAVAMGNAAPHVKKAAHWVTKSCEEDGVALAIEGVMD